VNDPLEALVVEQALAMVRELKQTADAAPDGQVLARVETLAVTRGRELIKRSVQAVLQQQAEEVEKRGPRAGAAPAAARGITAAPARARWSRRRGR
jgi:hypothetical protein